MGGVFAFASTTIDITTAHPSAIVTGMRITFAVAAILVVCALAIAVGTYRRTLRDRASRVMSSLS
jgi:threonine/homoserine/homoserine lactone efflux protein